LRTFYINPNTNDLEFNGSNNLEMINGDAEIMQSVRLILETNLEEWLLNPGFGFERSVVQGRKYDPNVVTEAVYAAVLQEERIASVEDIRLDFNRSTRQLKIDFVLIKQNNEILEGSLTV
jgi:phage baseplate assembly protein W